MTYPVMPMNLGNTKAPTMFESLMGFGKTALNPGDGTAPVNVAAVPGFGSFDNTNGLGSGAYGMDPIPGVMGGPSVNPIDAFTGQNNTGYTPLTQLGAGNFGSVGGDSIVDQMGTSKFWFGGKVRMVHPPWVHYRSVWVRSRVSAAYSSACSSMVSPRSSWLKASAATTRTMPPTRP